MPFVSFDPISLLLFIVVAVLPAYFMNKYLLKWIGPKKSFIHFLGYLLAVLAVALLYAFIAGFILVKFVWSHH